MFRQLAGACVGLAILAMADSAGAAIVQYFDYSDFQSTTTTSDVGAGIQTSANFSTNATTAPGAGVEVGAAWSPAGTPDPVSPMTFSSFSAFEIGMTFGNDDPGPCCGSTGLFDVTLSVFDGSTLLGSVTVATNGNDFSDQFIGLGSDVAFTHAELQYGAGSAFLAKFITRIDLGYEPVAAIPVPAALPLFLSALIGLGFFARWRQSH